jgi:hypothetical protein
MELAEYLGYVASFNSQDWDLVHTRYYAENIRFEIPIATIDGVNACLEWFRSSHRDIFETIVPKHVDISDGGRLIVAELDVQFILLADTPRSPIGPDGRQGDNFLVPMTARYRVGPGGRFDRLQVAFPLPPPVRWLADRRTVPAGR